MIPFRLSCRLGDEGYLMDVRVMASRIFKEEMKEVNYGCV
jgi:hypothetical protein